MIASRIWCIRFPGRILRAVRMGENTEDQYRDFERRFQRRPPAWQVHSELSKLIRCGHQGKVLDRGEINSIFDEFLPLGYSRCVADDQHPKPSWCSGHPPDCGNRCNADYWRTHNSGVAVVARRLGQLFSGCPDLFEFGGLLHDADYLRFPHSNSSVRSDDAHPMAMVNRLRRIDAPPELTIAVLEHAAHLGLQPTTIHSHVVIAASEYYTIIAHGDVPELTSDLPAVVRDCLDLQPSPRFLRLMRSDMTTRMNQSLAALADFLSWRAGSGEQPSWLTANM